MEKEPNNVLISLIIPAHNASKTLEKCLESVLQQNMEGIEIIIVNDGSIDSTQSIVESYAAQYPNKVRYFAMKNVGVGNARNFGIVNSKGKYIGFIDSDDYISCDYIESVKEIIFKTDSDIIMISYHRLYTRNKNVFEKFFKYSKWRAFNKKINLDLHPELISMFEVASWLRIVKRSLFEKNNELLFSDLKAGEDLETSLKWYLFANEIYITDKKLYHYVIRRNTNNFTSSTILNFIEVIRNVCEFYKQHEKFDIYYAELEHVFTQHLIISNLFRLMIKKNTQKLEKFDSLRASLLTYFPHYHKNRYLKQEPIYIRFVVYLTYKYPGFFKLLLRATI
jgi:glycosyltransferase involved in cell wall biosynthesis